MDSIKQKLSWQRDILGEARRLLVQIRSESTHGQVIAINKALAQVDAAMVMNWELLGRSNANDT